MLKLSMIINIVKARIMYIRNDPTTLLKLSIYARDTYFYKINLKVIHFYIKEILTTFIHVS